MRGSPISNLRGRPDYPLPLDSSPPRPSEADYWRQKARQLEGELLSVNEELMAQLGRAERSDDLEEKIELLLAQNTHFVDENENLIRLVQQKNGEIEVWRRKLDSQYSQSSQAEAEKRKVYEHLNLKDQEHQIQFDKLVAEITRLQNEAAEADNQRKLELYRIKNQYESDSLAQIQNLRRSQNGNSEIQELNIRKLKDTIEEKNFEIENLGRQIRLKNEELKAEAGYSKNELKKLEEQKAHEIELIKTEYENGKNNLIRAHKKNEDELKNLHEAKVKRLSHQIEEKKHEIEEAANRLKRSGKESEAELARLTNDNATLRNEMKENDNLNRKRIEELTAFHEAQFAKERETSQLRENNLQEFNTNQISILQHVIKAKEEEIARLLAINSDLKQNEDKRLHLIKANNYELKSKIADIVAHYQREVELTKIKVSQLYEADLLSLKQQIENTYSNHALEVELLRQQLNETREKLAHQVQERLDLRQDYELRLTEIGASHDGIQRELKTVVAQREKEIECHTSKASLTHIEHNQLLQTRNLNMKQIMAEKRNLQNQITSKNKEIEALNLKVQQMHGNHKRDITKLEEELESVKTAHDQWLNKQENETNDWLSQRKQLDAKVDSLNTHINDLKKKGQDKESSLNAALNERGLEIARLRGLVQELEAKTKSLSSHNHVEQQNVEKTILETRTLMNSEKDKLLDITNRQKQLQQTENDRVRQELETQIHDLRQENDILRDNYQKLVIREEELKGDVRGLVDSVNKRGKLEESVINVGLSNNYFKNVGQIFKRPIRD